MQSNVIVVRRRLEDERIARKTRVGRRRDASRQRVSARKGWHGSLALARGGVDVARRVGSRRVIASHAVAWREFARARRIENCEPTLSEETFSESCLGVYSV